MKFGFLFVIMIGRKTIRMKKIILAIAAALVFAGSGQAAITLPLYPEFKTATVYLSNHTMIVAPMNYDRADDKMYYKDGETVMELSLTNPVDSIVWKGEHSFLLQNGRFCEKVKLGGKPVRIQWRLKKVSLGKSGALGANSQSGNITEMNLAGLGMYGAGETGSIENFKLANSNVYFVPTAKGEQRISSLKQLYKAFPEKTEAAKAYVREKDLDLTRYEDFMDLLSFCLED